MRQMWRRTAWPGFGLGIVERQCQPPCCLAPCPVSAAFCEVARKLPEARKRVEDVKWRLSREQQTYTQWRCENWPQGSRMPEKVREICRNKQAQIVQLQELLKSREYDYGALRAKWADLYKQHVKECGRPPSPLCDCGLR